MDETPIIRACQTGDRDAQRLLFDQTSGRLYRFLLRFTGDPEEAFELTQETFVKGLSQIAQFDGRSSISTWLHRIAVNEALQQRRRRETLRRKVDRLASGTAGAYEVAAEMTLRLDVDDALERLSDEDRTILLLKYHEGFDYRTIAEITGSPLGTIASRLNRARDRLRTLLGDAYAPAEEEGVVAHPTKEGQSIQTDGQ